MTSPSPVPPTPPRRDGWWRRVRRHPHGRIALQVAGWLILAAAPVVGVLPGPGFIILAPIGLTLILQSSRGARRRYVRLTRDHPRWGARADRILRRARAARLSALVEGPPARP